MEGKAGGLISSTKLCASLPGPLMLKRFSHISPMCENGFHTLPQCVQTVLLLLLLLCEKIRASCKNWAPNLCSCTRAVLSTN